MVIKPVERICCVCRRLQPTTQMKRVVRSQGVFALQGNQHLDGRGAYVCPQCCTNPAVGKALSRSFKMPVPESIYQQLASCKQNNQVKEPL